MFSVKEKQFLASEIEKLLLGLAHPEMPKERPVFRVHVQGSEPEGSGWRGHKKIYMKWHVDRHINWLNPETDEVKP